MKTYLVGGAVRDALLGLPVKERDWVVVGATPDELSREGYQLVGRDFPVFLHPTTHEEYALARVERKTGPGYHGFAVRFSPDVTLEEDLRRRDLTINAIAQDDAGQLHDPYGGQADLEGRLLRHVSEAFSEDPVRILRVARFAARFAPLGFEIAQSTLALMTQMVRNGEAAALVPERVWAETFKALNESRPSVYFTVLQSCGALDVVFAELATQARLPGSAWAESLLALDRAAAANQPARVRLAAMLGHLSSTEQIESLCTRVKVPTDYRDLALLASRARADAADAATAPPGGLIAMLEDIDAFRRGERFGEALEAWRAGGLAERALRRLRTAHEVASRVTLSPLDRTGLVGPAIGALLRERRVAAVAAAVPVLD